MRSRLLFLRELAGEGGLIFSLPFKSAGIAGERDCGRVDIFYFAAISQILLVLCCDSFFKL